MTKRQVRNILEAFDQSSPEDRAAGTDWYRHARLEAAMLTAWRPSLTVERAAALIAMLSPQKQWDVNVRIARESAATGQAQGNTGDQNAKAQAVIDGGDVVFGPYAFKSAAFAACIVDPQHPTAVVIDRHAYSVAIGRPTTDAERKPLSARHGRYYDAVADSYREAAAQLGYVPSQLQAIVWCWWTRTHGEDERAVLDSLDDLSDAEHMATEWGLGVPMAAHHGAPPPLLSGKPTRGEQHDQELRPARVGW